MLRKYPRTPHIEGSRLQPGDEDLAAVPFAEIAGRPLVVEEKLDGANAAVSFSAEGELLLQSRGHYLTGGPRERQFARFKEWASILRSPLQERLTDRYVLYGEWMFAKHTCFYDALPHYFNEFDVLDRETGAFLSTPRRAALLDGLPVASVPVLHRGPLRSRKELTALVGPSTVRTPQWRESLAAAARSAGQDPERVAAETDASDAMEGLYIKVEEDGAVSARYKWVRAGFLTTILDSGTHWLERPVVANGLLDPEAMYATVR